MRKRYEVRGMMEWHPEFRVGRMRLQVAFTGGHLCGGAVTAASFETADPVVQKIIERSAAYQQNRIVVGATYEDEEAPAESEQSTSSVSVLEYSSEEEIRDHLHYMKGVPLESLCNEGACFAEADRLGVKLKKKRVIS